MPVDSKRLPVPENCLPPGAFVREDAPAAASEPISKQTGARLDGRLPNEIRPMFASVGVVTQAHGSAYIEIGRTKVICAAYGPREVKFKDEFCLLGQINCELKFATFSSKLRRQHQQDSQEKEASLIVKEALEPAVCLDKFPKARIDIYVIILEDDGSALSAAISAASLSLVDGGIEMRDLVIGATLRRFGEDTFVDPSFAEENELRKTSKSQNDAVLTIGYLTKLRQVSSIGQQGALDLQASKQCLQRCIEACKQVYPVLRLCVTTAVKQRILSKHADP